MKVITLFFAYFVGLGVHLIAQDTIYFMDGKTKVSKVYITPGTNEVVVFKTNEDNKYVKARAYDKEDVFMVKFLSGSKRVLYKFDPEMGNHLQVKEMYKYLLGEQYSRKYYHSPGSWIYGGAVGAGGALAAGFYGLTVVPLNYFLVNITRPRKPHVENSSTLPEALIEDDYFIEGFREVARRKKARNAIFGGFVGGLAMVFIVGQKH